MKLNTNDPRITAYILNELDSEERVQFEEEIEGCEESQAYIEDMRSTADLLSAELGQETVPVLATVQREKIEASLDGNPKRNGFARWLFDWRVGVLVPATACLLFIVFNISNLTGTSDDARKVASWKESYRVASSPMENHGEDLLEHSQTPLRDSKVRSVSESRSPVKSTRRSEHTVEVNGHNVPMSSLQNQPEAEVGMAGGNELESKLPVVNDIPDIRNSVDGGDRRYSQVYKPKFIKQGKQYERLRGSKDLKIPSKQEQEAKGREYLEYAKQVAQNQGTTTSTSDSTVADSEVPPVVDIPDIRNEVDGGGVRGSVLDLTDHVVDSDGVKQQVPVAWRDRSPAPTSTPVGLPRVMTTEERPQIVELASGASPSSPKPIDSIIYGQSSVMPSLQQEGEPLARAASTREFSRNLGVQTGAQVGKEAKPVPIGAAISEGLAESSERSSESEYFGWDVDADSSGLSIEERNARAYSLGYTSGFQRIAGDGSTLSAPSAAPASGLKGIGGGVGGGGANLEEMFAGGPYFFPEKYGRELNRKAPGVPQQVQTWDHYEAEEGLSYPGTEDYEEVTDNAFKNPLEEGYSTFSIDVDTAAYANMRRFLNGGSLPPKDAVRIEEMINYFDYEYPSPDGEVPFSANIETATCPWNKEHKLARIGLKGKEIEAEDRGPANLVFLIDVSGSMKPENKLPLLKKGLKLLVQQLQPMDRVAIVTYAGSSGLALPSTSLEQLETILGALSTFQAGGSTNGGAGIQLAYKTAREHFEENGINRVILATDGDFNVGVTDRNDLIGLIQLEAKSGIFLSVLGFGMGNLKDGNLESLADKGNGNYAYIDNLKEAQKVLVEQAGSTLVTIAKDVKIQVEFNPAKVGAYRLIGYENRVMPAEHFNDDTKDAGEIGAGHTVTALYEIVPRGKAVNAGGVDPMRYQGGVVSEPQIELDLSEEAGNDELLNLKLRYKPPKEDTSILVEFPVQDTHKAFSGASPDMRFAASVASFGMILRDSPYKGGSSFDSILEIARNARGEDEHGYRSEFVQLVELARALK